MSRVGRGLISSDDATGAVTLPSAPDILPMSQGGTGQDTSATTGQPDLRAGTWYFNQNQINVKTYGATGDGVTDDTAALLAAVTAANAIASLKDVVLTQGTYSYSDTLAFTTPVRLCGPGTMAYTGAGHAVELGPTGLGAGTVDYGRYEIDGVTFSACRGTAVVYVPIYVTQAVIKFCQFLQCSQVGNFDIEFAGQNWYANVLGNYCQNNQAVGVSTGGFLKATGADNVSSFIRIIDNQATGYALNSALISLSTNTSRLIGNDLAGWKNTLHLSGSATVGTGAGITANGVKVEGNHFEGAAVGTPLILFEGHVGGLQVIGNSCVVHGATSPGGKLCGPLGATDLLSDSAFIANAVSDLVYYTPMIELNTDAAQKWNVAIGNIANSGDGNHSYHVTNHPEYFSTVMGPGGVLISSGGGFVANQYGVKTVACIVPEAPGVEAKGTTGSTAWAYKIVAVSGSGTTTPGAATAIANGNATLSAINYNQIYWSPVVGAKEYRVYRSTAAGTPSTTGLLATVGGLAYRDVGGAASGAEPATDTSALVFLASTPTYADNTAALAGGLVAGEVYKTSAGVLMVAF